MVRPSRLFFLDGSRSCSIFFQRCDGARPTCGQCVRAEVGDCEYTDAGPTASQILEQNVAQLEARIKELTEGNPMDSITLHRPQGYGPSSHGGSPRIPSPSSPNLYVEALRCLALYADRVSAVCERS